MRRIPKVNIETSIASSAPMSMQTSTEAKIDSSRVETPIDIVMTTRTLPLGAMMGFLRRRGTVIVRAAGMAESTFGWCSNRNNVMRFRGELPFRSAFMVVTPIGARAAGSVCVVTSRGGLRRLLADS
jgi:hypothetical protein